MLRSVISTPSDTQLQQPPDASDPRWGPRARVAVGDVEMQVVEPPAPLSSGPPPGPPSLAPAGIRGILLSYIVPPLCLGPVERTEAVYLCRVTGPGILSS